MILTADTVTFHMFQPICAGTEDTCGWPAGGSLDIAAQIMVNQINARALLRGNFSLKLIVFDDHCDPERGPEEALQILLKPGKDWPFGVVGSGCSGVTKSIIPLFSTARVPLLSHAASATYLSDRMIYPNFFRMFPPDGPQIQVWFAMCKHFGWTKVALIYDEQTYAMSDYVKGVVDSYGGEMVDVLSGSAVMEGHDRSTSRVRNAVIRARVRAVLAISYAPCLRMFLCALVEFRVQGMYVFHLGWLASGWQYEGLDSLSCSVQEMDSITDYSFSAFPAAYHDDEHATSACALPNFTIRDFAKEYDAQRQALNEEFRAEASYTADAVCMMALLFNEMMDYTGNVEELFNMDIHTYRAFISKAQAIRFLGLSGPVWFPANMSAYGAGDRITPLTVFQKIDGTVTAIAVSNEGNITLLPGKTFHFEGGHTIPPAAEFDECDRGEVFNFQTEQCQSCPDDRIISFLGDHCECKPGYKVFNGTCAACNMGSFSDFPNARDCNLCDEGRFAAQVGMEECLRCPVGTYTDLNGSATCSDCPAHRTTNFKGAKSEGDCICEVGYYLDLSSRDCLSCGILQTTYAAGATSSEECYVRRIVMIGLGGITGGPLGMIVVIVIFLKVLKVFRRRILRLESKQKRYQAEVIQKAIESVMSLDHPMVVIRADIFLELGHLISYEQLRSESKLVFLDTLQMITDFKTEHNILFLSHQWLGWGRPDPENVHYITMCAAIRNAIDRSDIYDDGLKAPLWEWYVWCDYLSIAQASRKIQVLAIMSLPIYAIVSHAFVIVAPTCEHGDSGKTCDVDTYMRRGWCRTEMLSKLCGSGMQRMYIAHTKSGDVTAVTGMFFDKIDFRVFQGDFSCCTLCHRETEVCDKQNLLAACLGLYALILKQRERPWAAEVLNRIEQNKTDYFPTTFTFIKDGAHDEERELFGPLVAMVEEHINSLDLNDDTDARRESRSWDDLMSNVQSTPHLHSSSKSGIDAEKQTWGDVVANMHRQSLARRSAAGRLEAGMTEEEEADGEHRSSCEQADEENPELYSFPRSL